MKEFIFKNLKVILFLLSIVITILVGSLIGIIFVYQKGFPQIKNLEDIKPKVMTTIYDDRDNLIKEFAIEKRTIVRSSDIPEMLKKALVVAEDHQFYSHWGINFRGSMRAAVGLLFGKNWGGGSSITQQLARNLFLTREVSISRKLKEMLLAIQIEKRYSKDQILTFYCNKIPFGGPAYGVEAASRYYFGKSIKDINLAEAALLATVIPNPNGIFNVFERPKNCLARRNKILKTMLEMGHIDARQFKEAVEVELPEKPFDINRESIGDYFLEEVRKYIEMKFGDNLLYEGGLKVYTTLNSEMQKWAEEALKEGLRALDKRRGWRRNKKLFNVLKNNLEIEKYHIPQWSHLEIKPDIIVRGVALKVNSKRAIVKIDDYRGRLNAREAAWTRMGLTRILKKGDVALFRILEVDEKKKELSLGLEQEPEVQGAILVVENKTGEVKAMVGGYDFEKNKFNNATQALRQTGSTMKPIIYTAALENGYTPSTIIVDEPVSYYDEKIDQLYEPQNHQNNFRGPLTLRSALQQSRNVISAKLVYQLTPRKIVEYAEKFGITSPLKPYMSIALGVFEVTLTEMVAVITVFPNLGIRVNPYFVKIVRDHNNHIIEENYPDRKQVIDPDTAYVVNYLLQGVVKMGSGFRARHLTRLKKEDREYTVPLGGKTGTTDECRDAWFIGFSPSVTVGVWVGFKIPQRLGPDETGSRAASPVFVSFMEKFLEKHEEPPQFRRPPGVIMVKIDRMTGKLATPDCLYPFWEAFLTGTEPMEFCTEEDHFKINDYFDSDGEEEETTQQETVDSDDTGNG